MGMLRRNVFWEVGLFLFDAFDRRATLTKCAFHFILLPVQENLCFRIL